MHSTHLWDAHNVFWWETPSVNTVNKTPQRSFNLITLAAFVSIENDTGEMYTSLSSDWLMILPLNDDVSAAEMLSNKPDNTDK